MVNTSVAKATVAVAVILILGAGCAFVLLGDDEKRTEVKGSDTLWVMGNADEDSDIDSDDLALVRDAAVHGSSASDHFWYDANGDGRIDDADVEQLKSMIDGTADTIYYKNIDDTVCAFEVWDSLNIVTVGRCIAEEVGVVINKNPDRYRVVGFDKQCLDYDNQLQYSKSYPGIKDAGSSKNLDLEVVNGYLKDNGRIVVCIGSKSYYTSNLEDAYRGESNVQIVRLPSWEGDAINGVLTFGYLFGGVGDSSISGISSWDMAKDYADWANRYIKAITDETSKFEESQKKSMLVVSYNSDAATATAQSSGTITYQYSMLCGANNLGHLFGSSSSSGTVPLSQEDIASYAKDVDVVVFQASDIYGPNALDETMGYAVAGAKFLEGYVSTGTSIYSMSFMVFNGAPFVISMVCYAKFLYSGNGAIDALNIDECFSEYLDLIGWSTREGIENVVVYYGPLHTETEV